MKYVRRAHTIFLQAGRAARRVEGEDRAPMKQNGWRGKEMPHLSSQKGTCHLKRRNLQTCLPPGSQHQEADMASSQDTLF